MSYLVQCGARARFVWIAVCLLVSLPSCTGLGLGIGFAIDSGAEPRRMPHGAMTQAAFDERFDVSPGDRIEVVLVGGETREGVYRGFRESSDLGGETALVLGGREPTRLAAPALARRRANEPIEVPVSRVESVSKPVGTAWMVGLVVGLALDAVVVVTVATALSGLPL